MFYFFSNIERPPLWSLRTVGALGKAHLSTWRIQWLHGGDVSPEWLSHRVTGWGHRANLETPGIPHSELQLNQLNQVNHGSWRAQQSWSTIATLLKKHRLFSTTEPHMNSSSTKFICWSLASENCAHDPVLHRAAICPALSRTHRLFWAFLSQVAPYQFSNRSTLQSEIVWAPAPVVACKH